MRRDPRPVASRGFSHPSEGVMVVEAAPGAAASGESRLARSEVVAEPLLLRLEVARVVRVGLHLDRQLLDHLEAVALDADQLARVVREQAYLADAQVEQDLVAGAV